MRKPEAMMFRWLRLVGAALVFAALGCGDDATRPTFDRTPPTIVRTSPVDLATDVAAEADVVITFSEELDPSTVTMLSFTLQGPGGLVAGSVRCTGAIATFDPTQTLTAGATYTAFVTTQVRDRAGNALEDPFRIDFTVDVRSPATSATPRSPAARPTSSR